MAWSPYFHPQDLLPFSGPAWEPLSLIYPTPSRSLPGRRRPRTIDIDVRDLDTPEPSSHGGDLGWTLDYATAWAFRHLVRHRTEIADSLARLRRSFPVVSRHTPFHIFPFLDRVLFHGKLGKSVHLVWKAQSLACPGLTRAGGAGSKISVELNRSPFEDPYWGGSETGAIDVLLDQLIHQMIHAYFLVTCGPQSANEPHDGRLLDGLHFGVLLLAIWDIASQAPEGPLNLTFYAETRRRWSRVVPPCHVRQPPLPPFIALGPRPAPAVPPLWTGSSECTLDNRNICHSALRTWQVEFYAKALATDLEGKGDTVFDYKTDNTLEAVHRLQGPPSREYAELIWDEKRIMVPRERACGFASLNKALKKDDRFELTVPAGCSAQLFSLLYNFFLHGRTIAQEAENDEEEEEKGNKKKKEAKKKEKKHPQHRGAPAIVARPSDVKEEENGVLTHLRLFHIATMMEFGELQNHILDLLGTSFLRTTDPPIEILREVYGDNGPTHVGLHRWGCAFLLQLGREGRSNYEILCERYEKEFEKLWSQSEGLKEDCRRVVAELREKGLTSSSTPMRREGCSVCHQAEMRGYGYQRRAGLGEPGQRDLRLSEEPLFPSSEEDDEDEDEVEGDDEEVWISRRRRPRSMPPPPSWSELAEGNYRRRRRVWRLVPV